MILMHGTLTRLERCVIGVVISRIHGAFFLT